MRSIFRYPAEIEQSIVLNLYLGNPKAFEFNGKQVGILKNQVSIEELAQTVPVQGVLAKSGLL